MKENRRGEKAGERVGVDCHGKVTVLSPVTHTDVWGGEEEQEEDWRENRGTEKVKEITSQEETKEERGSNRDKDWKMEFSTKEG